MISTPSQSPPLKEIGTAVGRHLHPTIYKSEKGVLVNTTERGSGREMLSVAVRIQANHETHHVKVSVTFNFNVGKWSNLGLCKYEMTKGMKTSLRFGGIDKVKNCQLRTSRNKCVSVSPSYLVE